MIQTKSGTLLPTLSLSQIEEIRRTVDAIGPPPPSEYRINPDDWNELRRLLPPALPAGQSSEVAMLYFGTPGPSLTGLRIVLDVDAPRMPKKGGAA